MTFGVVTLISNKWIFPSLVCHLVGFFNSCFIHMAMFTAFHLLNERYHYRMNSRRHSKLYTTRRIGVKIAVFWVLCILLSIPPFIPGLGSYTYHSNVGTCHTPSSLLGVLPTVTNFIYLVLWFFITFNLVTLPRVSLPDSLKHKRSKGATFLPQLITSGVYTVASVVSVITTVLTKARVLSGTVTIVLERTSLLLTYISLVLIPVCVVAFSPELRLGLKEIFKRSVELSKYEQIDQTQHRIVSPEYPKNMTQGHVVYPDKKLPPQVQGYPRPVYTRPVRYEMYRHPADPRVAHSADPRVAHSADPRVAHSADPRAVHSGVACMSSTRSGRQVQRSHSTLGYLQRHHRTIQTGQRSQSLNRVSEPQEIEMSALNTTSTPVSRSGNKTDKTGSSSKTATSSVASSSTVADIVDL
ncbi:hypothetical protein ACHWQZ_G005252 [Mnemiopsis leidyi]